MAGPASESVLTALQDAERVAKKQKTCAMETARCMDTLVKEVEAARARMLAGRGDGAKVAAELHARLAKLDLIAAVTNQTKDVHSAVAKLSKVHCSMCRPWVVSQVCRACRQTLYRAQAQAAH